MVFSESGEMASGDHPVKAKDVHVGGNKQKILLMLFTSKTHGVYTKPQEIKIWADAQLKNTKYSPFEVTRQYAKVRGGYYDESDPFFVLTDGTPVRPKLVRSALRRVLNRLGLDGKLYGTHSFRIGRASDLQKSGASVDEIKQLGRWKSNAVFKYLNN